VNDAQIGDMIRFGVSLSPGVRGIHFQPVSYFGRYPMSPSVDGRITLDELIDWIDQQTDMDVSCLLPSRCDHPLCGFHGSFIADGGKLIPLSSRDNANEAVTSAEQNREYVGRKWLRQPEDVAGENETVCCCVDDADCCADECCTSDTDCCAGAAECCADADADCCADGESASCCDDSTWNFDTFLTKVKKHSFTISAMAFQDAMNLDIERLRRCSLRVYQGGVLVPFCARYITTMK
jgi:hypothetical protein